MCNRGSVQEAACSILDVQSRLEEAVEFLDETVSAYGWPFLLWSTWPQDTTSRRSTSW